MKRSKFTEEMGYLVMPAAKRDAVADLEHGYEMSEQRAR